MRVRRKVTFLPSIKRRRKMKERCRFCDTQKATLLVHIYNLNGNYLGSYPGCKECLEWKRKNLFRYFRYESTPLIKSKC